MSNITFTMIKPDAVANKHTGKIIDDIIAGGFSIKAMKYIHLSKEKAEAFYGIHRERPFFADLVSMPILNQKEYLNIKIVSKSFDWRKMFKQNNF